MPICVVHGRALYLQKLFALYTMARTGQKESAPGFARFLPLCYAFFMCSPSFPSLCFRWLAFYVAFGVFACDPVEPMASLEDQNIPKGTALGSPDQWVRIPLAEDPFLSEKTDDSECYPGAEAIEGNVFEVNTTGCTFVSFQQPSLESGVAGQRIRFVHWHLDLWAPNVDTGLVSLRIGDTEVYRSEYTIPGLAEFVDAEWELETGFEAGVPMVLHLRNHGINSWRFGVLELLDDAGE